MQKLTFTLLLATAGMALGTISAPTRPVTSDAMMQALACCDEPPPLCWPIPCDDGPPGGGPAEPPR